MEEEAENLEEAEEESEEELEEINKELENEELEEAEEIEEGKGKKRKGFSTEFTGYGGWVKSDVVSLPRSKFLLVVCKNCKNKQIVFSKASTVVRCQKCNEELAVPTGGEAIVNTKIERVLG